MTEDPIAQVFATAPDQLTDEQVARIIAHYREARKNFDLGDKTAGKTAKAPKKDQLNLLDEEIKP